MRKSRAASSSASSAESSSTTSGSSSSVLASSSGSSSKNKKSGSSTSSSSATTATINNTTTTTTATATGSKSSSSGDGCAINGTRGSSSGSSSNDNNNSGMQSAGQTKQQRPPLDRQFDVITDPWARQFGVATAPLATFDTVDLSDEELTPTEVTATEETSTTTTNPNSPGSTDNACMNKTKTTTTIATAATITAARTHETKITQTITDTTSCSNNSKVSAPSPRTSVTNNTNSTTITTTDQNTTAVVTGGNTSVKTSGKKSDATGKSSELDSAKKKSNTIPGGSSGKNSSPNEADAITSSAKTNRTVPALPSKASIGVRSSPLPDGVKDSDVTFKQSRVTDPHVIHSSSSDDDEGAPHVTTGLSSASPKCKPDSVSVESNRPTTGQGSTTTTPPPAAGNTALVGATAGCALLTATVDFACFGSSEDLNSNNIGGSQSTSTVDGGGSTAPAATGSGAASKPKEVSTVEKASLLDESSSSDSDLSPTEPNPAGGAYTTLKSGSTPNLIRKISHDATSTIKEHSGQPMDFNSPELIASSSKRKAYERRLQRLQVKTTPINRPRSTTPLSVVTLDEYTNLSSPEISPNLEKLKIVLPADQFGRPIKSPRSKENAFDFNEDRLFRHTKEAIVLQSDGSIGQSPRRIFIPPTLSPSQSPCKAAAGSPVSKLVLVSRLPAGTSPLVKPVISPPPSNTTTSFPCSTSSASSTPAWQTSDKRWEQFDESHSKPPQLQPQATCALPKRSEHPVAVPNFEKKQGLTRTGSSETSSSKGHQEKKKKKGSIGEDSKPTFEQHTTDSRRNTTSALNPSHHTHRVQMNCPDEEEEIIKIEIGSSEVGKAYNIELEVTAKEKMDTSHSKSSS